ncbi:MAG: hypothetical protein WC822_04605 [Candidatus Paceibacterota bacterium]|jgi:hypothetical protein
MYFLNESDNVWGLTEAEILHDTVSHKRLKHLIRTCDKVVYNKRSENDYGEFRFVHIVKGKHCLTAYGNGYHERRDKVMADWAIFSANEFLYVKQPPCHSQEEAIAQIDAERDAMQIEEKAKLPNSPEGSRFAFIADLTDDDFAMTETE